jgi:hypothetical protein
MGELREMNRRKIMGGSVRELERGTGCHHRSSARNSAALRPKFAMQRMCAAGLA